MIEKMLQTLLGELQKISRAETVVGEAVHCGDATMIPISRVHIGFGAGTSGQETNAKAGTGGGIRVEPVACVVLDKSGRAQLLPLTVGTSTALAKAIDLVPEVLDRLGVRKKDIDKSEEAHGSKPTPKK